MTTPRIYTYKVTFEEIPHWYWGVHKEKKFGELYLGTPVTNKWMWEFYTPKIQILEFFPYTEEGWKEANLVEDRIIKPDINNPLCLNEAYGSCLSLACCSKGGKKTHEEKDENGKSLHIMKLHETKNEEGKSLHALRVCKKLHEAKDENGRSLHTLKLHEKKDENGKSLHAVKIGKKAAEKLNKEKDENGKSVNAVKAGKKVHEVKDETGKSLLGLKAAERLHAERNEEGKSVVAVMAGKRGIKTLLAQVWESTVDGFRSHAGAVANHNKARGWDPAARVRIS